METLNYKVLEGTGYNGYILKDAPVKVMQFGEGNFLRAFVDYFYDIANEKAGYNGKVKLVHCNINLFHIYKWELCNLIFADFACHHHSVEPYVEKSFTYSSVKSGIKITEIICHTAFSK